jgi:ATP-dependent protease ClpP protease subunit
MNRFISKARRIPKYRMAPKKKEVPVEDEQDFSFEPLKQLFGMGKPDESDTEKNHIYYYTDVSQDSCLDLNRKITDLNKELLKHSIEYDCPPPNIYLHINSYGGDLLAAFSTVDVIKNSRIPIVSIVEGNAASAATIMSMVCHRRYITPNSFMLIHQLSSGSCGKYEELKDEFHNNTKFMKLLYKLYKKHTTMNDSEIKKILTHDIWLSSKECLKRGLVDGLWTSGMTSQVSVANLLGGSPFHTSSPPPLEEDDSDFDLFEEEDEDKEPVKKKSKKSVKK